MSTYTVQKIEMLRTDLIKTSKNTMRRNYGIAKEPLLEAQLKRKGAGGVGEGGQLEQVNRELKINHLIGITQRVMVNSSNVQAETSDG